MCAVVVVSTAHAVPTLSLTTDLGMQPLLAGDSFEVTLSMSDLGDQQVAGYLAFIDFDESEVGFISGVYRDSPFGLHHIDPIVATDGLISLSAGVDGNQGQSPTSDDAELVVLTFEALFDGGSSAGDCVTSIGFADHNPPSMLTDEEGEQITPLELMDLPPLPATRLFLAVDYGEVPVEAGDFIVVTLSMQICDGTETAGFQAFLHFDSAELEFVSAAYAGAPFSVPIVWPIVADGEGIALSAGIDKELGETPVSGAADLAVMTFASVSGGCTAPVIFAEHQPPTRLTDPFGEEITPLGLDDAPEVSCVADVVRDCIVNVLDLIAVLAAWGSFDGPEDINGDGIVDVLDLLEVLKAWGPCI